MPEIIKKENIFIKSFIIIGFNLYPKCHIYFDETFTSLFGKNGVGKTTLLDAIQIALIANQTYAKFNITTQKDDRFLGDYMLGSAGYLVFKTNTGFAFGIRLLKNPDLKVDIKSFTLENTDVVPNDFFEENILIDNLKNLRKNIMMKYPESTFSDYNSTVEYHKYLFEKGILSINISSKIYEFSLLYRSISTGILKQGRKMLKDVLSSNKSNPKKLIEELTKSIKQRKIIVSKISEINTIKQEIESFEKTAKDYDKAAYQYYCNKLNELVALLENLKLKIEKNENNLKKIEENIVKNNNLLSEKQKECQYIDEQYEKLLINIASFEKNYKAFENYCHISENLKNSLPDLKDKKINLNNMVKNLNSEENNLKSLKEELIELEKKKIKYTGEKKYLAEHFENYNKFNNNLQIIIEVTNEKINNLSDLENVLEKWENIHRNIENLHFIKNEFNDLNRKYDFHKKAIEQQRKLKELNIDFTTKEDLIELSKRVGQKIFELKQLNTKLNNDISNKSKEIDELLKGKIVLPKSFKNYNGKFLYKIFDDASIEESGKIEAILGELKFAPILESDEDIKEYANGKERLFFYKSKDFNIEEFEINELDEGFIIKNKHKSKIIRYEPKINNPIIGEKSRKRKANLLSSEIANIKNIILENNMEILNLSEQVKIINELTHLFDYLPLTDLEKKLNEKKQLINELEEKRGIFNKIKNRLKNLNTLKNYYGREDYKNDYEEIVNKIEECDTRIKHLTYDVKKSREKILELKNNKENFENLIKNLEKNIYQLEANKKQLEDEYPIEILTGKIDFTEKENLYKEKDKLYENKKIISKEIDLLKDKKREFSYQQNKTIDELKRTKEKTDEIELQIKDIKSQSKLLTNKDILPQKFNITQDYFYGLKALFEKELNSFLKKYNKSTPETTNILDLFNRSVVKIFPHFKTFDKLQEDLAKLHSKLKDIEDEIKSAIANFNSSIIENIQNVKNTLRKINNDLKEIRFGKIRKIRLKVVERESFHKLQKIHQSDSIMSFLEEDIDFEEFIKELGRNLGYVRTQATEDDVLNFKNYFDIDIDLYDEFGNIRNKGLSNGENLGTNIVIVLSMLTRLSEESFKHKVLPIVLDEADRLDRDSINTLYEIAKNWGLQMIVALPNIPNFHKGLHYHLIAGETGVVMPHIRYTDD